MLDSLNRELPGHKWYRGTTDIILEWEEPMVLQKKLAKAQFRGWLKILPLLFPAFSAVALVLLGLKVAATAEALSDVHWPALLTGAMTLGGLFCLMPLARIALRRWNPVVVRLASRGIGRWGGGLGGDLRCDYEAIQMAALSAHPMAPGIPVIVLTLRNGREAALALADSVEPASALQVMSEHGVRCASEAPRRVDVEALEAPVVGPPDMPVVLD
jgi:hypothetical protein